MYFTFIYFCTNLASRILFKDKERKWEEIENKLQAERDSLLLKSSNKVMSPQTMSVLFDEGWGTMQDRHVAVCL